MEVEVSGSGTFFKAGERLSMCQVEGIRGGGQLILHLCSGGGDEGLMRVGGRVRVGEEGLDM